MDWDIGWEGLVGVHWLTVRKKQVTWIDIYPGLGEQAGGGASRNCRWKRSLHLPGSAQGWHAARVTVAPFFSQASWEGKAGPTERGEYPENATGHRL